MIIIILLPQIGFIFLLPLINFTITLAMKNFMLLTAMAGICHVAFAQVPIISSFTPASGPIGALVTINGANFSATAANNTVYFGAVKAVVQSASTTSLTVTVPAGAAYK